MVMKWVDPAMQELGPSPEHWERVELTTNDLRELDFKPLPEDPVQISMTTKEKWNLGGMLAIIITAAIVAIALTTCTAQGKTCSTQCWRNECRTYCW